MNLMPSPCAMVVCDEGQTFPDIMDRQGEIIKYDRIVCDVPCSGDGTIRKNPNIWESWNPARGNSRFGLQLAIARRGVQLLKVGGLMAYSSCSINQVENEAVVAALLQEAGGSLELVDMEGRFPGLNWLPGLSHWRMFDTEMREYTHRDQVPERYRTQLPTVMFPPSHQTADSLNLHRCMRFLPHLNDDGGFFVAILRKTGEVEEKEARNREKRIEVTHANYKHWAQPKLFHLLDTTANIQFVGDCPRTEMACHQFQLELPRDLLYILRESSTVRLVSPGLAQILHSNNCHVKFAGGPGMQVLRRNTLGEGLEIQQYYIPMQSTYHLLAGLVGAKRKVIGSQEDATRLIYEESVPMDLLSLNVRDRLSALGHGWTVFQHAFPSFTLECLIFSSPNLAMFRLNKRTRKYYTWLLEE